MRIKPQSPGTPIRWSHPLAVGLVRAWIFNGRRGRDSSGWEFRDAVAGDTTTFTRNNADTFWDNGPAGPAFTAGADGGVATFRSTKTLSAIWPGLTTSSITVAGRYQKFGSNPNLESPDAGGGGSVIFSTRRAVGDTAGFCLYTTASAHRWVADGSGLAVGATYDTAPGTGWLSVAGTYRRDTSIATYGGTWSIYTDGILRGSNNRSVAGSFGGTFTDNIPTMNYDAGLLRTADKRFDYVYIWSRALSPQEVAWVTDQPFEMFVQRRAWAFAGEAGGAAASPLLLRMMGEGLYVSSGGNAV